MAVQKRPRRTPRVLRKASVITRRKLGPRGRKVPLNVAKSLAWSLGGAATTWAAWKLAQGNPEVAEQLRQHAQLMAEHPWTTFGAYSAMRVGKGFLDWRLLRNRQTMYNMDPAHTLVQGLVAGRTIRGRTLRPGTTAGVIATGSTAIDMAKQHVVKAPVLGLGAVQAGNPLEFVATGVGILGNTAMLSWRAWSRRRLMRKMRQPR